MCSDCEPICHYCGIDCDGDCDDPDTCPCCYMDEHEGYHDYGFQEACYGEDCRCDCHDAYNNEIGLRYEAGVFWDEDDLCYERRGVFPFLTLPGEIREKIYGYAFLQDGEQRRSLNHRGTIHTALLRTCRQTNKEARHLPLTINCLCFSSPILALNFLGFKLPSTIREFVTGFHVEYHIRADTYSVIRLLVSQLAVMKVTNLGITLKGGYPKEAILGHTCFTNQFTDLKDLKSVDLIVASGLISPKGKQECIEFVKGKLIKDYVTESNKDMKPKRPATSDGEQVKGKKPAKRARQAMPKIASEIKPKRQLRSQKAKRLAQAKDRAKDVAKPGLLVKYEQLVRYAKSMDISLVKIRLEKALKTARNGDQENFEEVARNIWTTLEEHYTAIASARKDIFPPSFEHASTPLIGCTSSAVNIAGGSQESHAQTESPSMAFAKIEVDL